MAVLFFKQHGLNGGQSPTPKLFRNIEGVKPECLGLIKDRPGFVGVENTALFDRLFKRGQFLGHKIANRFHEHPLFFGRGKIHGGYPYIL